MKIFSSEFAHNYGTYSFGYCNYCTREDTDLLSTIYEKGYLPYSGSKEITDTFYMARSTRIDLEKWTLNSENRRIMRKYDNLFERTEYAKEEFAITSDFNTFCLDYFEKHHGAHTMPRDRFEHIVKENVLTHIVEYRKEGKLIGYVFLAQDAHMMHVWFYFYAPSMAQQSFGMWIMLNEALIAQKAKRDYFYLGTAYGDKSRYKMNFSHLEFWDGGEWKEDKKNKEVKARIKNDHIDLVEATDTFKKEQDNYFS